VAIPFRVMGHPRSGNHLLASVLHAALSPGLPGKVIPNRSTGHWSQRGLPANYKSARGRSKPETVEIPYFAVLGTHNFPSGRHHARTVYIMRDGRDVAMSFYRWPNLRHPDQADLPLMDFLRVDIDWRGTPGRKWQPRRGYTIFDHWRDHVAAWHKTGAIIVRYEHLVHDPHAVVRRIARKLEMKMVAKVQLPGAVGWNPSSGKPRVGTWRKEMPREGAVLFDAKVPQSHIGRWPVRS